MFLFSVVEMLGWKRSLMMWVMSGCLCVCMVVVLRKWLWLRSRCFFMVSVLSVLRSWLIVCGVVFMEVV